MARINTDILKAKVRQAVLGVAVSSEILLSQYIKIKVEDEKMELWTTDGNSILKVFINDLEGADNFTKVVLVEQFSKLISGLTSKTTNLTATDNTLLVASGTSKYNLPELQRSAEEPILYKELPSIESLKEGRVEAKTDSSNFSSFKNAARKCLPKISSIGTLMNVIVYENGYMATDANVAAGLKCSPCSERFLLSLRAVEIISALGEDSFNAILDDNGTNAWFYNDNFEYHVINNAPIKAYKVEAVENVLYTEQSNKVTLDSKELSNALSRLSLFANTFDNGVVMLHFTEAGLKLSSPTPVGDELISYISDFKSEHTIRIHINRLMSLLSLFEGNIDIEYGSPNSLHIKNGTLTTVVGACK